MRHLGSLIAVQSSIDAQANLVPAGIVLEGIVQAGSYDPSTSTVQVLIGHTDAAAGFGDGDQPMIVTAALPKVGYGEQYGPVGNERAFVWRAGTQNLAFLHCMADDTVSVPGREFWNVHYDQSGAVDSYDKMTNDGSSANDGKGGRRILVGGYGTIQTTTGFTVSLDDTAKKILVDTPGGLTIDLDDASAFIELSTAYGLTVKLDNTGKTISATTPGGLTISLDDASNQISISTSGGASIVLDGGSNTLQISGSGTSSNDAIVRYTDLENAIQNALNEVQYWAGNHFQGGTSAPGSITMPTITASTKSFTA